MSHSSEVSPWQVGPVGPLSRIAAAALLAVSIDGVLAFGLMPHVIVALAVIVLPLLVAVRVVRGFEHSLSAAAVAFAVIGSVYGFQLLDRGMGSGGPAGTLLVGAAVCVAGLVASVAGVLDQGRTQVPTIEIEIEQPKPSGLVPARRPRRYH